MTSTRDIFFSVIINQFTPELRSFLLAHREEVEVIKEIVVDSEGGYSHTTFTYRVETNEPQPQHQMVIVLQNEGEKSSDYVDGGLAALKDAKAGILKERVDFNAEEWCKEHVPGFEAGSVAACSHFEDGVLSDN